MKSTMVKVDQFYPSLASPPSVYWRITVSPKLAPISSIKEQAMSLI
jgi:hypothetical protein